MKILIITLLISNIIISQNKSDRVIYLDSTEQIANDDNFYCIRLMKDYYSNKLDCMFYDFYKSGNKKLVGTFKDKYSLTKTGNFVGYYDNGNKEFMMTYENDFPIGKFYFWYEKGHMKIEGEFLKLKKKNTPIIKVNHFWSRVGIHRVKDGIGHFEESDLTSFSEGELKNGLKEGEWAGIDNKFGISFKETFKSGMLIEGISIDSLNKSYNYKEILSNAYPDIGYKKFIKKLTENIKIPLTIQKIKLTDRCIINFQVDKNGWINKVVILKSIGYGLEEEITQVLKNCSQWTPSLKRGIPIESEFTVPFSIIYGELKL